MKVKTRTISLKISCGHSLLLLAVICQDLSNPEVIFDESLRLFSVTGTCLFKLRPVAAKMSNLFFSFGVFFGGD